ncbi:uncharacterized protein LOC127353772 [Dicentrarchus labrax]|uniref:uncharacterized protein LOC127353772 n=1 Tax=Dicentrarchus labrax TaxID=13489 RepID=UPI0021F53195|nr:uncharacterized protein LOC127353772 [Dicentrarchus labrax]
MLWFKMPNIRQLPQRERKTRKWTPEAMGQAIQEVKAGRLSLGQAAKQFGVPKTSLSDRVSGRVASDCAWSEGHPEERRGKLGQTWWLNFRRRQGQCFTSRTPDNIGRGRASCAKRGPIEHYFTLLRTMEEHGLREKPRQIYNCDETGFQLDSSRRKAYAYRQAQGTRDHITVLACLNAAGEDIPPFIIYKGGYPRGPYYKEGVPDALYGHKSHLDPELVRVAKREEVILLCLPPHTSHILQPLDMTFFGPLKADFSGIIGDLSAYLKHILKYIFSRSRSHHHHGRSV